jgi:hypothetical protein
MDSSIRRSLHHTRPISSHNNHMTLISNSPSNPIHPISSNLIPPRINSRNNPIRPIRIRNNTRRRRCSHPRSNDNQFACSKKVEAQGPYASTFLPFLNQQPLLTSIENIYHNFTRVVNTETLDKIAKVLGVDAHGLLENVPDANNA